MTTHPACPANDRAIARTLRRFVAAVAILAAPAFATAARADVLPAAAGAAIIGLVAPRADAEIRGEISALKQAESSAGLDIDKARDLEAREKAMIEVKKSEIKTIDARKEAAEKAKQEGEKLSLEKEKKIEEIELKRLEKRAAMREAEKNHATARRDAAGAAARACEREIELATRRAEWMSLAAEDTSGASAALKLAAERLAEVERAALEAWRERAAQEEELAKRARALAEKRLELHEAQQAALLART